MKAMLVEKSPAKDPNVLRIAARDWGMMPGRPLPVWRPAPSPRRHAPATRPCAGEPARAARSVWIVRAGESLGEQVLMGLLGVAAVVAIGYGFAGLVDLVQNWAAFTSGIGQIIQ